MTELDELAARFETHRPQLRGLAFRMLGSVTDADDAVQEAWLRLAGADHAAVENLAAWLTTVTSRICLDLLRARTARREDQLDADASAARTGVPTDEPESEAVEVDEVGRALLVVLDTLTPPERIAFVLHDLFGMPFDEIAPVLGRSTATTKKLASRARLRVRGRAVVGAAQLRRRRRVVDAFLAASRTGDVEAVIAVLDPDVVRRADRVAAPPGRPAVARGARTVAEEIVVFGRQARFAAPVLVDGTLGVAVAQHGILQSVLLIETDGDRLSAYELIADPDRLARLHLAVLPE
jgi:RNA polymerase sigma factor (sigma-70 family)